MRYLIHTPNFGIWYPKRSSFDLVGYFDSDYAGDKVDRKSTSGTCQFLGLKCFTHGVIFAISSHLICLQDFNLSSWFTSLCWFDCFLIYIYTSILSSTTFTYSYVFICESFELSECDRTLISLCFLSQTLSVQIICILLKLSNVLSASLSAEDTETNIKSF